MGVDGGANRNEKIDKILDTYIHRKETDYALMLNGPWGCGKTFYVTGELRERLEMGNKEEAKIEYIYVSLNGVRSFESIHSTVTIQLLRKRTGTKQEIDPKMQEGFLELMRTVPKISKYINSILLLLGGIRGWCNKKKLKKIDLAKCFFVFDDLERISDNKLRHNIMGKIYENYVKTGGKVLFIADESKLDDEEYRRIKEKTIRRTIPYKPDPDAQLEEFIRAKYEGDHQEILEKEVPDIIGYLKILEIRNLRTVAFILDYYFDLRNEMQSITAYSNSDEIKRTILINIMIISDGYTQGKITDTDTIFTGGFAALPATEQDKLGRWESFKVGKDNISMPFAGYTKRFPYHIHHIPELLSFIRTGMLNCEELEQEIVELSGSPAMQALNKLQNYRQYETDAELTEIIDQVVKHSRQGEYAIVKLVDIYILLTFLKNKNFISQGDDNFNVENIIDEAFAESENHRDKVLSSGWDILLSLREEDNKSDDDYYKDLIKKIRSATERESQNKKKKEVQEFFDSLDKQDSIAQSQYDRYIQLDILDIIFSDKELQTRLLSLSNQGIQLFTRLIETDILPISNAGDTRTYSSKESWEKVQEFLDANINGIKNSLKQAHLRKLAETIKRAVKHLEDTRTA